METLSRLDMSQYNAELLYETVVFHLFNGGDSAVHIMSRQTRNYSVIMISELVNNVGESVVTDISYGISVHVRRNVPGA
jgi:hypothetical protein